MHTRRILIGALAAPALLLSACGGDDSIADPPVSSPPTSTATSAPPQQETPEHFIRRWAAEEKQMENTGRTSAYVRLSQKCVACRQLAQDIHDFYAAGGFARWGGWKILMIRRSGATGIGVAYDVEVDSTPTTYKKSAGATVQHLAGGRATHQLTIQRIDGGWQVISKAQLST
jgi:hypothetical protein